MRVPTDLSASGSSIGAGLRILVIDDDDFMRSVLTRLLRRLQVVDVHEASNGSEALTAVQRDDGRGFDLLICDIEMPDSDGMEFMRQLGELGGVSPLLVLSGKSTGVLHSVEILGAACGLTILGAAQKPPTLAILQEALEKCRAIPKPTRAPPQWEFSAVEITEALESGQFEPFFQPKVLVQSRRICGCEALARWRHPVHGILPPGAFVAQIEAGGLMERLTWLMLEKSCAWCRRWQEFGLNVPVSVNLSMSSLESLELGERIVSIVRAAGLVPSDLILEVTETIAMLDVARCLETLVRFRLKGFGLSIDDFGTGFSSLQQLERVPYSELKIDREFVNGASDQPRLRAVLESSASIARRLGMTSVGEGVETAKDWACLREVGCDVAQGYYIAKPMAGCDFLPWVDSWGKTLPSSTRTQDSPAVESERASSRANFLSANAHPALDRPAVIVVADDDRIARRTLALFLAEIPGEIHIFDDGKDALEAVERLHPDLVLVDIEMPILRGDDLCRQLRLSAHTAGIPVVIITGDESTTTRRSALTAGATDVITKPVQKLELLMRVRNLLALQRSHRELHRSRLLLEAQKTRHVRETFQRYMSPRLIDEILQNEQAGAHVGIFDNVRRCYAVMLFADLRGFTRLSEVLEPSAVASLLNEFFSLLVDTTHHYDGTTLSMAGDCLLVAFNVPYTQSDAELRAIRAACDMHKGFENLAAEWEQSSGVRTGLGIGINAGQVVAGNIGAPSYVNFTLIGDTVNVASRLKDRARAGEVLVTEEIYQKIQGANLDLEIVKVPMVMLKGKSGPLDAYSIIVTPRREGFESEPIEVTDQ